MFATRLLVSLFEFFTTAALSVLVVYVNYRLFHYTNPDYDHEEEIKKGNTAVAILLAALLYASGLMVQKGIYPVVSLFRLYMTTPLENVLSPWQMALYALAHVGLAFLISTATLSCSLRFYGWLTKDVRNAEELRQNNVAVGVMLAAVVLVVAMYMSEGMGSLSKSLIPQPSIGKVRIMR